MGILELNPAGASQRQPVGDCQSASLGVTSVERFGRVGEQRTPRFSSQSFLKIVSHEHERVK